MSRMRLKEFDSAVREYETSVAEGRRLVPLAKKRIGELITLVREGRPEAEFSIWRKGPSDYFIDVRTRTGSLGKNARKIRDKSIHANIEDNIWIVMLNHRLETN